MADNIFTVKSAGGDYSSLSAWEAARQGVIAAGDTEQAECYAFNDTTYVEIDGWTTVATGYIRIYTPVAERHDGTRGTGYRLTSNIATALLNREDYVRIDGLAISSSAGSEGFRSVGAAYSPNSVIYVESCFLYDSYYNFRFDQGILRASNNISIGATLDGFYIEQPDSGCVAYLYNNTAGANGRYGINRNGGTVHAKNNYSGGNTTADYNGTFSTLTTCASSDTTGTSGYQSIAYSTSSGAYFTNVTAGSEDLTIGASSALGDAGADLSGDANYPISTDFTGTTRSGSWDIGAHEGVTGGGGTSLGANLLRLGDLTTIGGITG